MAGGVTTPALVAAASSAGALGSFGFAYTQPEAMQRDVEAVRALTNAPINLNFFVNAQPAPIAPSYKAAPWQRWRVTTRRWACLHPRQCAHRMRPISMHNWRWPKTSNRTC